MFTWDELRRPFREALISAYNSNSLAMVLRYHCNKRLDRITLSESGFDRIVEDVIDDAEHGGWLGSLAKGVLHENQTHAKLKIIVPQILKGIETEGEKYYQTSNDHFLHSAPFPERIDLPCFVGRQAEIDELRQSLKIGQKVIINSLDGMGGIGKTELATHIAYQLRDDFPDGVLWGQLDRDDTMKILASFAGAYGKDVRALKDVGSRSRVVRSLLAPKRALIILDNAKRSDEIEHLLPPTGNCAVIVTTRRRDLSILRGHNKFTLNPFSQDKQEAISLFEKIIGKSRVEKDAAILAKIADLLGHLPLACSIAAGRLADDPALKSSDLLERLQEKESLGELEGENESVRLSFDSSYEGLNTGMQRFFAVLGVFGTDNFKADAAAAVARTMLREAQDKLSQLYRLSLVKYEGSENYRFHPLIRIYAREKTKELEISLQNSNRRAADHYLGICKPKETWLTAVDLEPNVLAIKHLTRAGEFDAAANLVHQIDRGYLSRWEVYWQIVKIRRPLVDNIEDNSLAIQNLRYLARACRYTGECDELLGYYDQLEENAGKSSLRPLDLVNKGEAYRVRAKAGDYKTALPILKAALENADTEEIELRARHNLGITMRNTGAREESLALHKENYNSARAYDNKEWIATESMALGIIHYEAGQTAIAIKYYEECLETLEGIPLKHVELFASGNHGVAKNSIGQHMDAVKSFKRAIHLAQEIGNRRGEGIWLEKLGATYHYLGDYDNSVKCRLESLDIAREINVRRAEAFSLAGLGKTYLARRNKEALPLLEEAYGFAEESGNPRDRQEWGAFLAEAYLRHGLIQQALEVINHINRIEVDENRYYVAGLRALLLWRSDSCRASCDKSLENDMLTIQQLLANTPDHFQANFFEGLALSIMGLLGKDSKQANYESKAIKVYYQAIDNSLANQGFGVLCDAFWLFDEIVSATENMPFLESIRLKFAQVVSKCGPSTDQA